jgi:Skp family chaperone for outer membrane proteins
MKRLPLLLFAGLASAAAALSASPLPALACTAADFGAVVDQTAQALRDLNINGAQRFQAKLRSLREKNGLSEDEIQARAAALQDDKMDEFNREVDSLFSQMDALSQTPNDKINCEKLEELKRVRDRLLTVMGQKSGYMLAKADVELDRPAGSAPPPKAQPQANAASPAASGTSAMVTRSGKEDRLAEKQPEPAAPSADAAAKPDSAKPATPSADAAKPDAAKPAAKAEKPVVALNPDLPQKRPDVKVASARGWAPDSQPLTRTPSAAVYDTTPTAAANQAGAPLSLQPPPAGLPGDQQLPPPSGSLDTTYSISEIQDAGRGIFGSISAQFAAAINYAFQQFGRPNAYIVGSDGSAAFLAGLRYGSGHLHTKTMPETKIYWQGPSLGYDLGAEGSSAMFLVYNLDIPEKIYGRFTGIGGQAYVAGGLGLNVLGKGGMVMVPIRSGVGLRIGANLAYLKFTDRQTWNPF